MRCVAMQGLFHSPVFVVNSTTATFYSTSGCSASSTATSFTSASSYQNSLAVSVGISGSYASASFSANADYNSANSGTSASQAFSFFSGDIAAVAVGQMLATTTIGMALDPSFLALAQAVLSSSGSAQTSNLQQLYEGYGT